jgi:RNA polymerase sigma factor (sigma-70 family)
VRTSDADVELQGREDESAGEIRQAILTLPASFRDVLLLRYVLQLSEDEVAEALGVRRGTVKSRTSRARKALGERLR